MNKKTLLAGMAAMMLAACQTKAPEVEQLNGQWAIMEMNGEAISGSDEMAEMTIDVASKRFSSKVSCNIFNGDITLDDVKKDALSLALVGSTRMMCPNMEQEETLQQVLGQVKAFEVETAGEETIVVLTDENGKALIKMKYVKALESGEWSIEGEWSIMSVGEKSTTGTESATTMTFDLENNVVGGNVGCNSISGQLELGDYTMKITNVSKTTAECDPKSMEIEEEISAALDKVENWSVENGEVKLQNGDGVTLITLSR